MANYIENFGLEFMMESEESFAGLAHAVVAEGKPFVGYYGVPYFSYEIGWPQFVARTGLNEEAKQLELNGIDTHLSGITFWKFRVHGMNVDLCDKDKLEKRIAIKREDGSGIAIISLVMADVLPSYAEDELITAQVVAFPELIHFYADEDEYANAQEATPLGKKFLLAEGSVFPAGLLKNHDPKNPDCNKSPESDSMVLIRGTVKKSVWGYTKIGEEEFNLFLTTIISTNFGDLEIVHTVDQVDKDERKNIREGATVFGVFYLSGDVAIEEHEAGVVHDASNNMALVRYSFMNGDPERLRSVLADNARYVSEANEGKEYCGRDEIINRLIYVQKAVKGKNEYAHWATITSIDEGEDLPYKVGDRCLVLSRDRKDNYECIAFVDTDEEGLITRIYTSVNPRYHFHIDTPVYEPSALDDIKPPESAQKQMLMRAHFHGFVDNDCDVDDVVTQCQNTEEYRELAANFVDAIRDHQEMDLDERFEKAFGYLFAVATGMVLAVNISPTQTSNYQMREMASIDDAFTGRINMPLPETLNEKIRIAMDYGKQFFKDFRFYIETQKEPPFEDILLESLVFVQQIGEVYGNSILVEESK